MNDDKPQATDDEPARGPVAGERLAEARRLKQISLPDVARQLHLDEPRVQALEENRFDMLGAPVFAKGYLRKYAKLVGAPIDDVMAEYYLMTRASGAPPVVGPPRKRPREIDLAPWLFAILIVIVLAGAAYWWMQRRPAAEPPPATDTRVPLAPSRSEPIAGDIVRDEESPGEGAEPQAGPDDAARLPAATQEEDETEPVPAAPAAAAPAGDGVELRLAFSGDCWTEVSDADGKRLFFGLGSEGRTVTVQGAPPLRVLLGNDENVRLTVNGRPYSIAAADRRGNTARLTIRR
jgi:cytoskeleton protein RodZ